MEQQIQVVIVDDSPLMQRMLTSMLERDPALRVVGAAANGKAAIDMVERLRPDVITMDVGMPIMDGLAATEHLMAFAPTPILVLTAQTRYDVDLTFKMLGAGALDVVTKPDGNDPGAFERQAADIIRRIKLLARVKVVRHIRGRRNTRPGERTPSATMRTHGSLSQAPAMTTIIIGASTGGPRAVKQILSELPAQFDAGLIIVQHIAEGFSAGMAEWLGSHCKLPVLLAADGQPLRTGQVLIAPDRCNLLVEKNGRIHLSYNALLLQQPSVDIAMQAVASVFGSNTIGVLLTGMGRDGARGLLTIRQSGGHTIAQDEATSAIFGMPRAAIEIGAAEEVLPLPQIAERLVQLVQHRSVAPKTG